MAVPVAYGPSHSRRQPPPVLASPKVHVDLYRGVPARVAVAVADRHAAPVDVHPQPVPRAGDLHISGRGLEQPVEAPATAEP